MMKGKWFLLFLTIIFCLVSIPNVYADFYFGVDRSGNVIVWKDKWAIGVADTEFMAASASEKNSAYNKLAQALGPYTNDTTARNKADNALNQSQINSQQITNINADLSGVISKNTEQDVRLSNLEKDKEPPIILTVETKVKGKTAVDISKEGNSIVLVINAQDNLTPLSSMQYSYRRNGGSWSGWVSIPASGNISVSVGNGANNYEIKVRDNASTPNQSLVHKFDKTIWGL